MEASDQQPPAWEIKRNVSGLVAENEGLDRSELESMDVGVAQDDLEEAIEELIEHGFLEADEGNLHADVPTSPGADDDIDVDYTIRVARQEDLANIKEVIREVTAERTYVEAETVAEELDRQETLVQFDEERSRMFFVAEVDGNIVGWLHIESPEREKLKHTAQFTVGVSDEYRGIGLGERLMTRGLEWAEAHGYHKVYNDFPATNRGALAFLDALDYDAHCEAVHRDHYMIGDRFVDQMTLAVYLSGSPTRQTHFDRVQQEAEEIY